MPVDPLPHDTDAPLVEAPAPEVLTTVRESCLRAGVQEADLCRALFRNLAELVPVTGQADEDRLWTVSDVWVRWVMWAALSDAAPSTVESALHEVGAQLGRHGLTEDWFRPANSALLRAVRTLHPDWGTALSSCWVSFLGWLAAYAVVGAAETAAQARTASGSPDGSTPDPLAWPQDDPGSGPASADGHGTGRRRAGAVGGFALDLLSEIWCGLPRMEAASRPTPPRPRS